MAKKKTKSEDFETYKSEMLLHIICEACTKAALTGSDTMCVLLAALTEVGFYTMSVERTDENFEEIAELVKKKFLEGLKYYRDKEEKKNENRDK